MILTRERPKISDFDAREKSDFADWNYTPKYEYKRQEWGEVEENELSRILEKYISRFSVSKTEEEERKEIFSQLVAQWKRETRGISSSTQIAMHPAYQQIVGMGESAVPLLLRELEQKSGRWFWALKAITREDPVPSEKRGRTKEMVKAWLEWGRRNGYTW